MLRRLVVSAVPLALVALAALAAFTAPDAALAQDADPLEFRSDAAVVRFSPDGTLERLTVEGRDANLAAPDGEPVLEIELGGHTHPVTALSRDGTDVVARFGDSGAAVRVAVSRHPGWLRFEIVDVTPATVEAIRFTLRVTPLANTEVARGGTYDDDVMLCLRPISENANITLTARRGAILLRMEAVREHGLSGAAAAFIVGPRATFFDTIYDIETKAGLATMRFGAVHARESAEARQSYLFLTAC